MAAAMPEAARRFGHNVAIHRKRNGYSQEALAFRAALHPTWLSCLEAGKSMPGLETILKLAGALGIPPVDLLDGLSAAPAPEGTSS
jgi:transcriptional regulator with XRE-family HTH domain